MHVLFLGEGDLWSPARYLSAILKHMGATWDHASDQEPIPAAFLKKRYDAIVFSDYRHAGLQKAEAWITEQVSQGTGLLMIGGWASFTGLVGGYSGSALEQLLPIRCVPGDDRVNWASGVLLSKREDHSILKGISFKRPPVACGYQKARVKRGAQVLMDAVPLRFQGRVGRPMSRQPLLVVQNKPRTAVFLTDCAPHWAGGLVDWGSKRITVKVSRECQPEIGDMYLKFFGNLIRWVGSPQAVG
jgi:uncharacterized membrane protein